MVSEYEQVKMKSKLVTTNVAIKLQCTSILTFWHTVSCEVELLPRIRSPDLLPALSSTENEQKITLH